jgi:hypothetical protein
VSPRIARAGLRVVTGWSTKVAVEVVTLLLSYAVVPCLKRAERVDHYDQDTNFNPLRSR